MQWILQCAPELRPWLACLYDDMHRFNPSDWPSLPGHLSDSLRFLSTPHGADIPIGSTSLLARRKSLQSKPDLQLVPVSSRRIWMHVADPQSSRHMLCELSREMLRFLLWWCRSPWPLRPLALPPVCGRCVFGEGPNCGVGSWLQVGAHRYSGSPSAFLLPTFERLVSQCQPGYLLLRDFGPGLPSGALAPERQRRKASCQAALFE